MPTASFRAVAVICECNPLHYGHLKLFSAIRKCYPDHAILALMSGNFVQRAEPAVHNKYARAKAVISPYMGRDVGEQNDAHADLVLELPFPYAMGSAEYFAAGAVATLNALNESESDNAPLIEILAFGSESGDAAALAEAAKRLMSDEFAAAMKGCDRQKQPSFARARSEVYASLYGEPLPDRPNEILAVEYIKALQKSGSKIAPHVFAREDDGFSAGRCRESLLADEMPVRFLPPASRMEAEGRMDRLWTPLITHLRLTDPKELERYAEMEKGMGHRMHRAAMDATGADLVAKASAAHQTNARLRRAMLMSLIGVKKADLSARPGYTLLLAATDAGTAVMRRLKKRKCPFPILAKPSAAERLPDEGAKRQAELTGRAEAVYALACEMPASALLRGTPYTEKTNCPHEERKDKIMKYCPKCMTLCEEKCRLCGSKKVVEPDDCSPVYLISQNFVFIGAIEDLLKDHGIPCLRHSRHAEAALSVTLGHVQEMWDFYVPYGKLDEAKELMDMLFSEDGELIAEPYEDEAEDAEAEVDL